MTAQNRSLWQRLRIDRAPSEPGVYIMRDTAGAPLYIGKAKSLRTRLRAYTDPARQGPKTALLLQRLAKVDFFVTDSELEALVLENSLIKKWHPRYNITLKDDKTYPFLRLSVREEFPTLSVVRKPLPDGARYFGPYVPAGAMRETLRLLQRIFPLRRCRRPIERRRGRPCLNYQMQRCLGPCTGNILPEEYREMVKGVTMFLQGKGSDLTADLRRRMEAESRALRFEEAALLRDRIAAIDSTLKRQKAHLPGRGDLDVIGTVRRGNRLSYAVIHIRNGRIIGTRSFYFTHLLVEGGEGECLRSFLQAFYEDRAAIPPEILTAVNPERSAVIASWLERRRGKRVLLRVPRAGQKRSLVDLASRNALRVLQERKPPPSRGAPLLKELGRVTGCGSTLHSLAAVDVSNLSGTDSVASLVWWEGGKFNRREYRRFRIRQAAGRDDYAMLEEVVRRLANRVASGQWRAPDIMLLDGGRGQLSAGEAALAGMGWRPKLLLAIAKPSENRELDAVFTSNGARLPELDADSPVLRLLQSARDEAHRFALSYHRRLRQRRVRLSALDEVRGIGEVRKKILLERFGSFAALREVSLEELSALPGFPAATAGALYRHLHPEE